MTARPHIILLMADHLRLDCLAASGRKLGVKTPHLDTLAEESVVFDRAYCTTPLCCPTRTAIASGKWPHFTRCIINGGVTEDPAKPFGTLGPEHETFYEGLVNAGYTFTLTGIQHVHTDPPLPERIPAADINREMDWGTHLRARGFEPIRAKTWIPIAEWCKGKPSMRLEPPVDYLPETDYGAEEFRDLFWANSTVQKIRAADPRPPLTPGFS